VLSKEDCGDYTRETLRFSSREELSVFAYLLLPKDAHQPLPAILCLHGHGPGADPIVGLNSEGKPLSEPEYQNAFAVQAVRHGYAALAIEILAFGRRREAADPGFHGHSCQTLSGTALMLGQSMAGWRTYDAMRAIDYLETRPEIDANRLGAMGISGGGLNTLYLAAVDTRVKAAMVSGFLNTFRDSIMSINHCIDNFVPGLLLDAEMTDIAGLVAPRALWCENGTRDSIFPVAAFRRALRDVKKIYGVLGAPDKCDGEVFDGEHQFHGVGAWGFLEKHLKHG
jgi:dienelactone hydrolase